MTFYITKMKSTGIRPFKSNPDLLPDVFQCAPFQISYDLVGENGNFYLVSIELVI